MWRHIALGAAIGLCIVAVFLVVVVSTDSAQGSGAGMPSAQVATEPGAQAQDGAAQDGAAQASAAEQKDSASPKAEEKKAEETKAEPEQAQSPVFDDEPEASSVLPPDRYTSYYGPKNAVDGNIRTAWNDGGSGVGEWISLEAKSEQTVKGLRIVGGYPKREDVYYKNYRPKDVTIELSDGYTQQVTLEDKMGEWQEFEFDKAHKTDYIKVTIDSVYGSNQYDDVAIAELEAF